MYTQLCRPRKTETQSSWDGLGWNNGIPDAYTDAYVNANYTTDFASFACRNLYLSENTQLTVKGNNYVKVLGSVTQSTNSKIIVEDMGGLILLGKNPETGSAHIQVKKAIEGVQRLDYGLLASPFSNIYLKRLSPQTLDNRFYNYDNDKNALTNATPATQLVDAGQGYLVRTPNNHPSVPANWNIVADNFAGGSLNAGVILKDISYSLINNSGYNMAGNPYSAPISLRKFYEANKDVILPIFYVWSKRTNGSQGSPYIFYNETANTFTNDNNILSAMQGFFVTKRADAVRDYITFTPDMQLLQANFSDSDCFNLLVDQENINFPIGSLYYSAAKFPESFRNIEANSPTMGFNINGNEWLVYNDNNYSIDLIIPLSVNVTVTTTYTIYMNALSGVFAGAGPLYITDNTFGIKHNLKEAAYTFSAESGTVTGRFFLSFK